MPLKGLNRKCSKMEYEKGLLLKWWQALFDIKI